MRKTLIVAVLALLLLAPACRLFEQNPDTGYSPFQKGFNAALDNRPENPLNWQGWINSAVLAVGATIAAHQANKSRKRRKANGNGSSKT